MLSLTSASHMDINQLQTRHRDKEKKRLECYEEILRRCHTHICIINDRDMDHTMYQVPSFLWGRPPFNQKSCMAYLIHNLRQNGFHVYHFSPDYLFIAWNEEHESPCPPEIDRATFQSVQPISGKDEIKPIPPPIKNKEQKLLDINRSVFRPVPSPTALATKSVYDKTAFQSLQLLADRIKKK